MFQRLKRSKTLWTALAGMAAAVLSGLSGQLPWDEVLPLIFQGAAVIFLRDGIAKGKVFIA